jgi:hypothetical protein
VAARAERGRPPRAPATPRTRKRIRRRRAWCRSGNVDAINDHPRLWDTGVAGDVPEGELDAGHRRGTVRVTHRPLPSVRPVRVLEPGERTWGDRDRVPAAKLGQGGHVGKVQPPRILANL